MSRKDFVLIAAALRSCRPDSALTAEHDTWAVTARRIADSLQHSNERFDRARFLDACGVKS